MAQHVNSWTNYIIRRRAEAESAAGGGQSVIATKRKRRQEIERLVPRSTYHPTCHWLVGLSLCKSAASKAKCYHYLPPPPLLETYFYIPYEIERSDVAENKHDGKPRLSSGGHD